jgi:hypothetical protein
MKRKIVQICLAIAFMSVSALQVEAQVLSPVGFGWSRNSVNTTVFRNNSLTTHGDTQYIAYYDAEGYLTLGKRAINTQDWTVERTQYKGNCADAHNVISIGVDGKGYLHVSFDHHNNPLRYCRAVAPGSLELGEMMPMTGVDERDVTYPEFYNLEGGDLLLLVLGILLGIQLGTQIVCLGGQLIDLGGVLGIDIFQITNHIVPVEAVKCGAEILCSSHRCNLQKGIKTPCFFRIAPL